MYLDFVAAAVERHGLNRRGVKVLELGRSIEGHPRDLFTHEPQYQVLSPEEGPDVDILDDVAHPSHITKRYIKSKYDVVICTGVLECMKDWSAVLETAFFALCPGGRLILTCAGHVSHMAVRKVLERVGFRDILTYQINHDTQASAVKPHVDRRGRT